MKTIETRFTLYAVGLAISTIVERLITANIIDREESPIYFHVLSAIILIFLFILTTAGIKQLVENRHITRWIHRKNYIGGRWIEIVVDNNNQFHHYNILDIDHGAYSISLVGTTFDEQLNYKYKFASLHATLEPGDVLSYTYIQRDFADSAIIEMGMLQFFSHSTSKIPTEYFGSYRNITREKEEEGVVFTKQEVFNLRAFKLEEDEAKRLKNVDFDTLHDDAVKAIEHMSARAKKKLSKKRVKKNQMSKVELECIMEKYKELVCVNDKK